MQDSRLIDHLVLPVSDLETARNRLSALGFTVAPDAHHPFGTGNACVVLPDGLYLEPLAVYDRTLADRAVSEGNVFVARDRAYRQSRGEDGFSAIVLKTDDAQADDAAYRAAGISGGPMLRFSRDVELADGTRRTASFHLAFAATPAAPDFFLFACQRVAAVPLPPRHHANGAQTISGLVLTAPEPAAFSGWLEQVLGPGTAEGDGFRFPLGNSSVALMTPAAASARFGLPFAAGGSGLLASGIVYRVASLAVTAKCLVDSGVAFVRQAERIVVAPAAGQGAVFAFEE